MSPLRIALATPRMAATRDAAVDTVDRFLAEAAEQGVALVCFPETWLPGYRGAGFAPPPPDQRAQEEALDAICDLARTHRVAVILPAEWESPAGLLNVAFVIGRDGVIQGFQTKNQIAPEEDTTYVPGTTRRVFTIDNVPFGVVICHEGWRYPETVRWAAQRGAKIVFHPHLAGSDNGAAAPREWGKPVAPFFESAMIARAMENRIWFASVNFAVANPETASSVIAPDGRCVAHAAYGKESLLVVDVDPEDATGLYAQRLALDRYGEETPCAPG